MTNIIINPGAEVNTANASNSNAATISRTTTRSSKGTASFQVVTAGTTGSEGVQLESPINLGYTGTTRAFYGAADLSGEGVVNIRVRILYTDASNVFSTTKPVTLSGSFETFTSVPVTLDPAKTVNAMMLQVVTTSVRATTFYVDEGWMADTLPAPPLLTPILRLGSPHIGPLRVGKA